MEYNEDDFLLISGIQHYAFCQRQWALIHIENQWQENGLTAEGRVQHEHVHSAGLVQNRNGILTMCGFPIKSNALGITGQCDAVEFVPSESGIFLNKYEGTWKVYPVEYKHGTKKINDCDRLQLTAQVICLEEMFSTEIDKAYLFYEQTKRREEVIISKELKHKLTDMCTEMHQLMQRGYTPVVKVTQSCRNCSLNDICLPNIISKRKLQDVSSYIEAHIQEES